MMYIETMSNDPAFNLALEQYAFDKLALRDNIFMLWQNRDAVIVGLHQNTAEEINSAYASEKGIAAFRRLSGGGAVFHDLGNLNYSIITEASDSEMLDFRTCCEPITAALRKLGIRAEVSGRNDISVEGRKFSGNARYLRGGRLMHHGTILVDTDLDKMSEVLRVTEDKYSSGSVKSVRARVTNLREHFLCDMTVAEFWDFLRKSVVGDMPAYTLSEQDISAVRDICRTRYMTWEWNYGRSPEFSVRKRRRIEGFGTIRLNMCVADGRIAEFVTDGDYFGNRPCGDVADALRGVMLETAAVTNALMSIPLGEYYEGLTLDALVRLIIE